MAAQGTVAAVDCGIGATIVCAVVIKASCWGRARVINEQILGSILDAGELLLTSGAEVGRVEDTIRRMANAYGFVRVDVLSITASVVVTARHGSGEILTQTRRILRRDTDMQRIEQVNALSREICRTPIPAADLAHRVAQIASREGEHVLRGLPAYLIIAGAFTLFFGGTVRDALAALLVSMVLFALDRGGKRVRLQPVILTLLCASALCLVAIGLVRVGLGQSVDKIVIGNIMLLIPGIALVTSLRDMIVGDTISGLLGTAEALLRAVAIAAGCALVLVRLGGV